MATRQAPVAPHSFTEDEHSRDTKYQLTRAEAIRLVKAQPNKTRFYVHVSHNAAIAGDPDHVFTAGCSAGVRLTYKDALRLAEDLLTPTLEAKGGRMRISINERFASGYRSLWFGS